MRDNMEIEFVCIRIFEMIINGSKVGGQSETKAVVLRLLRRILPVGKKA